MVMFKQFKQLAPPTFGVRTSCCPLEVLGGEAVSCPELIEAGREALLARATVGSGFFFSLGRYLRFLALLSHSFAQSCALPTSFISESSRLKLARDLLTVLEAATPWASGL